MSRILPLLLAPLLLLAVLWSSLWWWSATRLEQQFQQWQAREAARGREFHFTDVEVGGFPTHLRLSFSEVTMSDPSGWYWRGPAAVAESPLWQPRQVRLEFPGTHEFRPPEASMLAPLELATGVAQGELWLDRQGRIESMWLEFERLALAGYFAGATMARELQLAWGKTALQERGEMPAVDATPFMLELEDLELPSAAEPPLGRSLDRLLARGSLEGWSGFEPPLAESIPAWAQQGGAVKLEEIALFWGPLRLEGNATLTLDDKARPLGVGTARILGFEATLDAFTEAGLVQEEVTEVARFALLAMSSEDGQGHRQLKAPVTAQDGMLRVGPLPLFPLPPLF